MLHFSRGGRVSNPAIQIWLDSYTALGRQQITWQFADFLTNVNSWVNFSGCTGNDNLEQR